MFTITQLVYLAANAIAVALHLLRLFARPRSSLVAENLFLRKQLAFYEERQSRPRRLTNSARFTLATLSQFFDWRAALVIVKPDTLVRLHRKGFKIFWNRKSRLGRPPLPKDLQWLIAEMVRNNATWGQARIANELSLKLGILVSPCTVRAYWPRTLHPSRRTSSTNWQTFVRNHAKAIVACDFLVAVTARFRILYVFLVMEIGSRRIVHFNVTSHPTAAWSPQRLLTSRVHRTAGPPKWLSTGKKRRCVFKKSIPERASGFETRSKVNFDARQFSPLRVWNCEITRAFNYLGQVKVPYWSHYWAEIMRALPSSARLVLILLLATTSNVLCKSPSATSGTWGSIEGHVMLAGKPMSGLTVTLAPKAGLHL